MTDDTDDCMAHEDIVEFTTHGRLAHERGEVEVFRVADDARTEAVVVRWIGDADAAEDADGRGTLGVSMMVCTSTRVVVVFASTATTPRRGVGLRYSAITRVERMQKKHMLSRMRRVRVATGTTEYEFHIKGSDGDTFARVVEEQVRKYEDGVRRAQAAEEAKAQVTVEASAATAGIGGVFNRQRERVEETNRTLDEAFSDLSALMSKARELVVLAERLAESSGTNKAENSELQRLVMSLGITSPVTRATSGASFHHELSRQLADWIVPILAKEDGIITLTDAFCLFNRARGTELVSPQDMLAACESWDALGIDLHLRRFESGVVVIHTKERSDEHACSKFKAALSSFESSIDSYEAAQILHTTPEIALEYLYMAESEGILCRDDGPRQMRFFANRFSEF